MSILKVEKIYKKFGKNEVLVLKEQVGDLLYSMHKL